MIKVIVNAKQRLDVMGYHGAQLALPTRKGELLDALDQDGVPYGSGEYVLSPSIAGTPPYLASILKNPANTASLAEVDFFARQFITWQWTYDHKGLNHGHYYDNYAAAKEDFAYRSSLAPEHHRFSEEQAQALHHAICSVRDDCEPDIAERLDQCMSKLEQAHPKLAEQQALAPTMEPEIGM